MKKKEKSITLGKNIRIFRKEKGWTQRDFAKKLNCSQAIITAYENDVRKPTASKISFMADLFGVNVNELFGDTQTNGNGSKPKDPKLWKRFEKIQQLPPHEKRTVLKMIDGLLAQKGSR